MYIGMVFLQFVQFLYTYDRLYWVSWYSVLFVHWIPAISCVYVVLKLVNGHVRLEESLPRWLRKSWDGFCTGRTVETRKLRVLY